MKIERDEANVNSKDATLIANEPVRHNLASYSFPRRRESIIFNLLSTVLLFLQYF